MARAIDWPSEVLPTPGGPTKHRIGALPVGREFPHGEIFDDPPLDLVEIVVIVVEDAARFFDVDRLFLGQRPRQLDQPVEVGPHHAVFAGGFGHALEPAQFLARCILDLLRHFGVGDRLFEFGNLGGLAFLAFAELALNCRHLLAQQHLALTLVERHLSLPADFLRQPQHFDPVREHAQDLVHARRKVDGFENVLLLVRLHVHIGDGEVGERSRRLDRLDRGDQIGRRLRQQLDRFQRLARAD